MKNVVKQKSELTASTAYLTIVLMAFELRTRSDSWSSLRLSKSNDREGSEVLKVLQYEAMPVT